MVLVSTCSHIVYIVSCRCVFREESNYRFILSLQFSYIICILVLCSVAIMPKQSYSTKVESNLVPSFNMIFYDWESKYVLSCVRGFCQLCKLPHFGSYSRSSSSLHYPRLWYFRGKRVLSLSSQFLFCCWRFDWLKLSIFDYPFPLSGAVLRKLHPIVYVCPIRLRVCKA